MKKNKDEIELLRYRIKRYKAMGNGAMCQLLNGKLKKITGSRLSCRSLAEEH